VIPIEDSRLAKPFGALAAISGFMREASGSPTGGNGIEPPDFRSGSSSTIVLDRHSRQLIPG
jgi:hypothetical protein